MAEGIFKKLVEDRAGEFSVGSAGIGALDGFKASDETVQVMKEHGIDVSGHRSRRLTVAMVRTADKVFVMEAMHKLSILESWPEAGEKIHLLTEYSEKAVRGHDIDIPDPIRMPHNFYRNVFTVIRECVGHVAEEFGIKMEEETK